MNRYKNDDGKMYEENVGMLRSLSTELSVDCEHKTKLVCCCLCNMSSEASDWPAS